MGQSPCELTRGTECTHVPDVCMCRCVASCFCARSLCTCICQGIYGTVCACMHMHVCVCPWICLCNVHALLVCASARVHIIHLTLGMCPADPRACSVISVWWCQVLVQPQERPRKWSWHQACWDSTSIRTTLSDLCCNL